MTQTAKLTLFALGAFLMCISGLFTAGMRWVIMSTLAVGFAVFLTAVVKSGSSRPLSALWLLVTSNLSFWICYGLWHLRLRFVGPSPETGVDVFAGTLSIWLILLAVFALYEIVIFSWSILSNHQRTLALIGLIAVFAQVLTTLRFAYKLVQGV